MKTMTKKVWKSATTKTAPAANAALYAAARKVGMDRELARIQAEVIVSGGYLVLTWDHEQGAEDGFVFPTAAWDRAEAWLTKWTAK